jgi:hypothetical protein
MQEYKDTYLENQVRQVARLQAEGKFIAADEYLSERLPLPRVDELPGIEYDTKRYGYVAPWGRFARGPIAGSWLLVEGTAPESQTPIQTITARVENNRVFIEINGQMVSTPERWLASENAYQLLAKLNAGLVKDHALSAVVCRLEWDESELDKRLRDLRLANEHVGVVCSSIVWDSDHHQLVAATLVSPEQQSLRAITATLATNSKKSLSISVDGTSHYIQNARRGFTCVSGNLAVVGAEGHVLSILHPLAGNPQEQTGEHFYVVAAKDENLAAKFAERLNLAIPFPVQLAWAEYLLEAGSELVSPLPLAGDDFPAAVCVQRDIFAWQEIIQTGLKQGKIKL